MQYRGKEEVSEEKYSVITDSIEMDYGNFSVEIYGSLII